MRHQVDGTTRRKQFSVWVPPLVIVVLVVAIQLATIPTQLSDENFVTVWMFTAIQHGDVIGRDVYDIGVPLSTLLSIVGQLTLGHHVLSEFLLDIAFIAAGFGVASYLAHKVTGSAFLTLVLSVPAIALLPRLYGYPKVFIFPVAILMLWRYIDCPTRTRLFVLSIVSTIAFLFRHDFGIYVVIATVVAVVVARARDGGGEIGRALAAYVAVGMVAVSPFLVYVQATEGLLSYVRSQASLGVATGPLMFTTGIPFPCLPWNVPGCPGFRSTLLSRANAEAWLFWLFALLPFVVLAAAVLARRGRADSGSRSWSRLVTAAVLMVFAQPALLRQPGYIPDTAASALVLGAGLLRPSTNFGITSIARHLATALMLLITLIAVAIFSDPLSVAERQGFFQPGVPTQKWQEAITSMAAEPLVTQGLRDGGLIRYLHDCSRPDDRLLLSASGPFEIPYVADRSIAGGHLFFHFAWRGSAEDQQRTLDLIQRQSLLFVVSAQAPVFEELRRYDLLSAYLASRYVELPPATAPDGTPLQPQSRAYEPRGRILVDGQRTPTGVFDLLALPCYS